MPVYRFAGCALSVRWCRAA